MELVSTAFQGLYLGLADYVPLAASYRTEKIYTVVTEIQVQHTKEDSKKSRPLGAIQEGTEENFLDVLLQEKAGR